MPDDTIEPFGFPAAARKKVTAAFDGGRLTSDGGVMLLAAAERRLGIVQRLAVSTPEEECIGGPEQNYITDDGRRPVRGLAAGWSFVGRVFR